MGILAGILKFPVTAVSGLARAFALASPAVQVAAVVAIFQLLVVGFALAVVLTTGERTVLQAWWSPGKGLALLGLLLFIPWLAYHAARLWFDREGGRWPDVAAAWAAARDELGRQQVSLAETPVFVVLGTDGGDLEQGLFADLTPSLRVHHSPAGSGPLHVYAGSDAVFVCLSGVGVTAALGTRLATPDGERPPGDAPRLSTDERRKATDRLEFACDLLRSARLPLAPLNGILAVLTLPIDRPADNEATTVGQALGEDFATLTRVLGVRAPVTFVAASLQHDPAIADLLTRLAPADRLTAAGVAFPPGLTPSSTQLGDLAANAAGPLIDRLAALLLDPRRIGEQPVNRRLLGMLCRQGLIVNQQLARVLTHALASRGNAAGSPEPLPLFSGVAVAAVTKDANRRAFVRGLLDRVVSLQGELEWTTASLVADRWAARVARIFTAGSLAMAFAGVAIAWWKLTQ